MRRPISLFFGLACILISACSAEKQFTIYDSAFAATDLCASVASIEMLASDGGTLTRIDGNASTLNFMQSDNIIYWCEGVKINFIGAVTYGGYVFDGNAETPLQFTTNQEQGFHYTGGTGAVTESNGTIHTLPPSGSVTIGSPTEGEEAGDSELINVVIELVVNVFILVAIVVGLMVGLRLRRRQQEQSKNLTASALTETPPSRPDTIDQDK